MTTHTISVYNPKGGTGRTTLAVHLADYLAARGARLLLRDADPQGSALGWAYLAEQVREADKGQPLRFTVGRGDAEGYDIVLTDHGPADGPWSPKADIFVVPVSLDGVAQAVGFRAADTSPELMALVAVAARHRRLFFDELHQVLFVEARVALLGGEQPPVHRRGAGVRRFGRASRPGRRGLRGQRGTD